ncbi:hypothetical protein D9M68_305640 [compost metagenome]
MKSCNLKIDCIRRYIAVNEVEEEGLSMAILTVRNVPDEVHRALRVRIGDALAELSGRLGLTNEDFEVFDQVRDKAPGEPMRFE